MPVFVSDKEKAERERFNANAVVGRCVKCEALLTASDLITNPLTHEHYCKACWAAPVRHCEACGEVITGYAVQINARDDSPKYAHEYCIGQTLMVAGTLANIHKQLAEIAAMPAGMLKHINPELLTRIAASVQSIIAGTR